jgi:hypothetical protein
MGLADDDHAGRDQPAGQRRRARRPPLAPARRAAGDEAAVQFDQVFQRDRNAVQRPDRVAGADRLVGRLGGEPGVVGIDLDEAVEPRLQRRDAREASRGQIDGREAFGGDLGG